MGRKPNLRLVETKAPAGLIGKRLRFDRETWNAISLLASDQMKDLQELTDEAFRDLLTKHGRPLDLKEALKMSVGRKGRPKT